jgi:uncharacterized protein YndB with AHSA1/START domain
MSETVAIEPVRRTIMVDCPMEEAFRVFTTEIASWWPLLTHSIGGEQVERLVFEEYAGGEVYEVAKDGARAHWADVLAWEPPARFVLDWQVNPTEPATELEVRFAAEDGGTRVELEHRGWERLGERGEEARGNYANGWVTVLGRFEERAGS